LQGFFPSVWIWALTRFISAFCLAGLFIVIESWLLAAVHDSQKGQIMAIYLLAYYIIQALSQLLLKINFSAYWMAFGLIAALAAFSIIPIVFAKNAAAITGHSKLASPLAFFKKAPLGVSSGLVAGLMFAMVYTMFPLFLAEAGYPADRIANIMSITLVGGALLQLPIGKISDHCDRRVVITIVSLLLALVSLLMALTYQHYLILMMLCFIWGGLIFVIYPLSISHTSDCVGRALAVSAVSVITLIYSAGSMLGPLGMSALMSNLGRHGFFAYTIMSCSLLGLYGLYSVVRYRRIPPGQFHASFPEAAIGEQIVESKNQ
jgi:MFS family permease